MSNTDQIRAATNNTIAALTPPPCPYTWCGEPGLHHDHAGAEHTVTDTRGEEVLGARLLWFSGSTPTVAVGESDFTPETARITAAGLRALADTIARLADTAEQLRTGKTGNRFGLCASSDDGQGVEQRTTALAAALYIARHAYGQATTSPNPAARLDDMCDAVAEAWDDITPKLPKNLAGADLEFAETMRAAVADRLWAFTAVEHARIEAGDDYGYVFDLLADGLKGGASPKAVRDDVPRVAARIRAERATSEA